jgi:hypothetical protein
MKNMTSGTMKWMKRGFVVSAIAVLTVTGIVGLPSCKKNALPASASQTKDDRIRKVYERGPVRLEFEIDHQKITVADRLNLSMTVIADESVEIEFPPFGEKLEQFGVVDYHTTLPELVDKSRKKICRSYILEPFLSGEYAIPPLKVRYHLQGEKADQPHVIETEQIVITVASLLPEKMAELKIHDIKPPVSFPRSYKNWLWSGAITGLLALAGAVLFVIIRKRKLAARARSLKKAPPHETAFKELEELLNDRLVEKNEIKRFYQRISDIFRRYIENRYRIKAPELTTEEFLSSLKKKPQFTDLQVGFLNEFLRYCDLVKFAEHQPETGDIQKTFDTCKNFILETKNQRPPAERVI